MKELQGTVSELQEAEKNFRQQLMQMLLAPLPLRPRSSTHLLLHPFGTRAIARDVPLDMIQAQMEHASIKTTSAIYGRHRSKGVLMNSGRR